MSMNCHYYVGPYIKCTTHETGDFVVYKSCPKHSNELNINGNFCSICGSKFVMCRKAVQSFEVSASDIIEMLLEKFGCETFFELRGECGVPLIHYYGINVFKDDEPRGKWFFQGGHGHDDYTHVIVPDVVKEKDWFESAYAEEIKAVREMYDKVEIEWGIVGGYS